MADVWPFCGIRYNLKRINDLSKVICPPYDVISPEDQLLYHHKSPFNIIRLELGEELPGNSSRNNKHIRAATTLSNWLRGGILVREEHPAFYLVEHRLRSTLYGCDNSGSCWGLIAAVRLEDLSSGRIRPTEKTLEEPIIDRLRLLKSCRANLSPVISVFDQAKESFLSLFPKVISNNPSMSAVDKDGVTYNLWVISDEDLTGKITRFFADKVLYIADGHHRYETAITYCDEQLAAHPGSTRNEAFNFVMMTLINAWDADLILLPIHRLVKGIDSEKLAHLKDELATYFHIEELSRTSSTLSNALRSWLGILAGRGNEGVTIGLCGLSARKFWLLIPREISSLRDLLPKDKSWAWKDLDVNILHWVILRRMLDIDSLEKEKKCLEYSSNEIEVMHKVLEGGYQLAFFLNPTPISKVLTIADANARMPQKSNYFHPKTPAGLVINPLWGAIDEFAHDRLGCDKGFP